MKKAIKTVFALLLGVIMLFSVACTEEWNYLHEDLDKSNLTPAQFAEWMYNRTKTSIKISRPDSEIVYNIKTLLEDYESTDDYIDGLEADLIKSKPRTEHLSYYSLLSDILVEHAKRTDKDEIWVGKTWRDTGRALNMSSNGEVMALIANQIMARGVDYKTLPMYKTVLRSEVAAGETIVEVVTEGKTDDADTVRVSFVDAEKAFEIVKTFIQNAIYARPTSALGSLYVLSVMYRFAQYVGYTDPYVYIEEYAPGNGEGGANEDGSEIIRTKVPLTDHYQQEYIAYIGV